MLLFFAFFLLGSMAGAGVQSWLITVLHTVKGHDAGGCIIRAHRLHGGLDDRRTGRRLVRRYLQATHAAVRRGADHRFRGADADGGLAQLCRALLSSR